MSRTETPISSVNVACRRRTQDAPSSSNPRGLHDASDPFAAPSGHPRCCHRPAGPVIRVTPLSRLVEGKSAITCLLRSLHTRAFVEWSQWVVSRVEVEYRRLTPACTCRIGNCHRSLHLRPGGNAAWPRQSIRRYGRVVKVVDDRLLGFNPIMCKLSTGTALSVTI